MAALKSLRLTLSNFRSQEKTRAEESKRNADLVQARLRRAVADEEAARDRRTEELKEDHAKALRKVEDRFESRRARIEAAANRLKRRLLDEIEREEDKRKYNVQKGVLDSERSESESIAGIEAERELFNKDLARESEELIVLGKEVRRLFAKFPGLGALLRRPQTVRPEEIASGHRAMLNAAVVLKEAARKMQSDLANSFPIVVYRILPVWLVAPLLLAFAVADHFYFSGQTQWSQLDLGLIAAAIFVAVSNLAVLVFYRSRANHLAETINRAAALHANAPSALEAWRQGEAARIRSDTGGKIGSFNREWLLAIDEAAKRRARQLADVETRRERLTQKNESLHSAALQHLAAELETALRASEAAYESNRRLLESKHDLEFREQRSRGEAEQTASRSTATAEATALATQIEMAGRESGARFPHWSELARNWTAPAEFPTTLPFAGLSSDLPSEETAGFGINAPVLAPLTLRLVDQACMVIDALPNDRAAAFAILNNTLFRLVTNSPPGQLSLTIFDPLGLGQNFPAITHLGDYESKLLNGRIWTQPDQLEARLTELNTHIEKVIQVCLRNEYADVLEYNKAAGNIAERFHFLVLADFPANISDTALRLLMRIASAGPRCGVFTLLHFSGKLSETFEALVAQLRQSAVSIRIRNGRPSVEGQPAESQFILEEPPAPTIAAALLEAVGSANANADEVRVPFSDVAPSASEIWTESTAEELRVPVGRSGPNKLQWLALGRGTRQHALIAGKTGSGKSTLFHVIVTNLALWCSPDEVEFYLIDFKKGIEFKSYASHNLPHARVIAIESDREFGLSVLQRIDQELRRRGDLFRKAGVQDLAAYRATSQRKLPRSLLLIDEFQEFFTEDDRIAQSAAMLLDRIVRQGRAFGVHVILGSQTLAGAYSLARSTLGQMVVRIALQSNEADASLIMDENNSAARLLSRPGEGIYNDQGGAAEANSGFQVVWLPENERDQLLDKVSALASNQGYTATETVVFEGNAPADFRENRQLVQLLERPTPPGAPIYSDARIWLGAANSVKGPTEAVFADRSGSNLLIVGQSEEPTLAILATAIMALAYQFPAGGAQFILLDGSPPDSSSRLVLKELAATLPAGLFMATPSLDEAMKSLSAELDRAESDRNGLKTFVFIHQLQNFRRLKIEDEYSFSSLDEQRPTTTETFARLLTDGPRNGIHTIVTVDTATNVNRFIGRRNLGEFEMRALFQMNPNDSAGLCDDPRASSLGLHKALFYHSETGSIEIFRPYSLPELPGILEHAAA